MFGGVVRRYKHFSKSCGCDMTFSVFVPPPHPHPLPQQQQQQQQRQQQQETSEDGGGDGASPVLLFLSGLTCTDENFTQKSGAQRAAAARGIALVAPDTSPRGLGIPGEDEGWDLGTGAGFYVDATEEPWVEKKKEEKEEEEEKEEAEEKKDEGKDKEGGAVVGYRMFSYVTVDLLEALKSVPGLDPGKGIALCGHS